MDEFPIAAFDRERGVEVGVSAGVFVGGVLCTRLAFGMVPILAVGQARQGARNIMASRLRSKHL
jgi:hypothetical protein